MKATIAIPARLHSSRLPRKVLADIAGRPMIEHVYEAGVRAGTGPVVVLTDDEEVAGAVRAFGGAVRMTSPDCPSGTARIASVAADFETDLVVNLQGDAPLTDPQVLARLVDEAAASGTPVTMPVYRLTADAEVHSPNVVKVVRARGGQVLYCSRAPIPYVRDPTGSWVDGVPFYGHPGLYAYRRDFVLGVSGLPPSPLERAESLEQLAWLEAGARIHSFEVPKQAPTVDTPADLEWMRHEVAARAARG